MTPNSEFVELKGGTIILTEAILLALNLEDRGFTIRVEDDKLFVSQSATGAPELTIIDREAIKRLKRHLLVVASYDADANFDRKSNSESATVDLPQQSATNAT